MTIRLKIEGNLKFIHEKIVLICYRTTTTSSAITGTTADSSRLAITKPGTYHCTRLATADAGTYSRAPTRTVPDHTWTVPDYTRTDTVYTRTDTATIARADSRTWLYVDIHHILLL